MIRKLQEADIDRIAEIWLDTNIKAHDLFGVMHNPVVLANSCLTMLKQSKSN